MRATPLRPSKNLCRGLRLNLFKIFLLTQSKLGEPGQKSGHFRANYCYKNRVPSFRA